MAGPDIAFFDAKPYDMASFDEVNRDFSFPIEYFKNHLRPETAVLAKGRNTVCAFVNDIINREVIDILSHSGVKLIAMRCAGYNNIDLKAAGRDLRVVRVPAYSPHAVAEHTVGLMLTLNRKIHRAFYRTRDSNFNINGLLGFDMHGKTAGIIGTGKIGKILINILRGFEMNILAYDPFPDQEFAAGSGCRYVSLSELYSQSNIISLPL